MRKNYFTVFLTSVFVGAVIFVCEIFLLFFFLNGVLDPSGPDGLLGMGGVILVSLAIAALAAGFMFVSGFVDVRAGKLLRKLSEDLNFKYMREHKPKLSPRGDFEDQLPILIFNKTDAAIRHAVGTPNGLIFGLPTFSPLKIRENTSVNWGRAQYVLYGSPETVTKSLRFLPITGGHIANVSQSVVQIPLEDGTVIALVVLWMSLSEMREFVPLLK